MLSKEEIEAFMEEAEEFETATSSMESPSASFNRSVRMVSLSSRTQMAMFRSWQRMFHIPGW